MTTYARIINRTSYLSTEFGESYARRLFGDYAVDQLPRYVKGKRKGLLKGLLCWSKAETGGWQRDPGRVVKPNQLLRASIRDGHETAPVIYAEIFPTGGKQALDLDGRLLGKDLEKNLREIRGDELSADGTWRTMAEILKEEFGL